MKKEEMWVPNLYVLIEQHILGFVTDLKNGIVFFNYVYNCLVTKITM
jgi:hypothetical protein